MPDGDHLLIGLHHPRGAAMTRCKREANLQGWDGCSTCHDGLLAAVTSASQEAAPSGVGPPETRHHSQVEVVSVEYSSRTLPKSWQLCRKCKYSSLWRPYFRWHEDAVVYHARFEPLPEGASEVWAGVDLFQEGFLVDAVKAACDVCIEHIPRCVLDDFEYLCDRILTGASGSASKAVWFKPGFPFWFEGQFGKPLCCPVVHDRNAEWAFFQCAWLGYPNPAHWFHGCMQVHC